MSPFALPPTFRLMSIDGGSYKCGVSYFLIDSVTTKILEITSETIYPDRLHNDTFVPDMCVPDNFLRYLKLRNALTRKMEEFRPHAVAYEGPFMNTFRPNAYGPLVALCTIIHEAVVNYNLGTSFNIYQPQVVKKHVKISGKKGKEVVLEAIQKVEEIMATLKTDLSTLDDNAIDSIIVGWAFIIENMRSSLEALQIPEKKGKTKKG